MVSVFVVKSFLNKNVLRSQKKTLLATGFLVGLALINLFGRHPKRSVPLIF
jgi:hypothetical protein